MRVMAKKDKRKKKGKKDRGVEVPCEPETGDWKPVLEFKVSMQPNVAHEGDTPYRVDVTEYEVTETFDFEGEADAIGFIQSRSERWKTDEFYARHHRRRRLT